MCNSKGIVNGTNNENGTHQNGQLNTNFYFGTSYTDENGVEHHHITPYWYYLIEAVAIIATVLICILLCRKILAICAIHSFKQCFSYFTGELVKNEAGAQKANANQSNNYVESIGLSQVHQVLPINSNSQVQQIPQVVQDTYDQYKFRTAPNLASIRSLKVPFILFSSPPKNLILGQILKFLCLKVTFFFNKNITFIFQFFFIKNKKKTQLFNSFFSSKMDKKTQLF